MEEDRMPPSGLQLDATPTQQALLIEKYKQTTTGVPQISGTSTSHPQPGSSSQTLRPRILPVQVQSYLAVMPQGCTWRHTVVGPTSAKGKMPKDPSD